MARYSNLFFFHFFNHFLEFFGSKVFLEPMFYNYFAEIPVVNTVNNKAIKTKNDFCAIEVVLKSLIPR